MRADEIAMYLLLGCVIGLIGGGLTNLGINLEHNHHKSRNKTDRGFMKNNVWGNVALVFVLILSVWASFASQRATNQLQAVTHCNKIHIRDTLAALNGRTVFVESQAQANIALQKAQSEYLRAVVLDLNEYSIQEQKLILRDYIEALTVFLDFSEINLAQMKKYPYPDPLDFNECIKDSK